MKIHSNFAFKKTAKKSRKNWVWDPPGLHFEEFRGALGRRLGAFLAFLARSGALLGRLLGFMGASDLIWGGFGEGLGGILRGFGESFARVLEDFGRILKLGPPRCLAPPRGASQFEFRQI